MNRKEKIDVIIEFLDENHITIIETANIQGLIIDAQVDFNESESAFEHDELIEKGLTDEDLQSFISYLEYNMMMMVKTDEVTGVSFENCEILSNALPEIAIELWKDEEEEQSENS